MNQPKLNNGDKVKCRVTGLEGIVVATTTWLNGCIRYVVQPQEIKDGKPVDSTAYDENDLKLLEANTVSGEPIKREGGPQRGESTAARRV